MEDDGLDTWRRLGASQGLRYGLMSSQLLTHQRQRQRQIATLPRHNGADELDDPDGMAFQRTPMVGPTDPLPSSLPGIDADGLANLTQRRGELIFERDGIK